MILAKPAILAARKAGDILIEPFKEANLCNSSFDVTLGETYWRETHAPYNPNRVGGVYFDDDTLNPYDKKSVMQMWGERPHTAETTKEDRPGIPKGTKIIPIHPGQNLLCHTVEFIGGTNSKLTTMIKARSSIGRNQITICRCAGWGDIGFHNRYVLEVSNYGKRTAILVVGMRVAQVVFLETTGLMDICDAYYVSGKYQTGRLTGKTFAELEASWNPEMMLPKMWEDLEPA